ncbi:MAG: electron transport complex subunit RsxC [Ruminococcus sp.]|jgi:electron transport complex protein RnfC|nr:electron transport complex subunit RsxC [Ruminococcus sp.]
MKNLGGVKLRHHKNTKDFATQVFKTPEYIFIPMAQTMGAPCEPIVKKGDTVKIGQKIADTKAFMSAPIHSPVSGEVAEISDYLNTDGRHCPAVKIIPDGLDEKSPDIKPPVITDRESLIYAVRESGLAGLGGAAFPTHIKFSYDPVKTPVDTLVINGAECEPFITSDYRCFLENSSDIIEGILLVQKILGIPFCKICIEDNKPEAIALMKKKIADSNCIDVVTMPSLYPQGAEKVVIYKGTGRIVCEGQLPVNVGVVVLNVSTVAFIAQYARTGIPLIKKRLTLDGTAIKRNAGNYLVPVGTPIKDLLDFGGAENVKTVLYGGPMMGVSVYDTAQPVLKSTNAILAFSEDITAPVATDCIRCGKCMRTCPLNLMPMQIEKAYKTKDIDGLKDLRLMLCMNCGCCSYACPAHRPLAEYNQLAKALLKR